MKTVSVEECLTNLNWTSQERPGGAIQCGVDRLLSEGTSTVVIPISEGGGVKERSWRNISLVSSATKILRMAWAPARSPFWRRRLNLACCSAFRRLTGTFPLFGAVRQGDKAQLCNLPGYVAEDHCFWRMPMHRICLEACDARGSDNGPYGLPKVT